MDYAHCIRQAGRGTLWLCRPAIKLLVMCLLLMAGAWMAGLLAYRLPVTEPIRYALGVAVFIGTLGVAVATWFGHWKACGGFIVALGLSIWWWSSIHPSLDRNWAAEVSRTTHSNVTGDEVVVHNVRNFDWKSETDFAPRWEQRSYRLAELKSADLFLSYWAGEAMAHTILSFGFEQPGGIMSQLAFSFERRSQTGQVYSPVAGLFKEYELAAVGADERDIIRVRANVRGEDARLYRLNLTPHEVRSLFQEYLKAANQLAAVPRFYNTLTTNCTTVVFGIAKALAPNLSYDWKILVSGFLPKYLYGIGVVDTSLPFSELQARARINAQSAAANAAPDYSQLIRAGIPVPYANAESSARFTRRSVPR